MTQAQSVTQTAKPTTPNAGLKQQTFLEHLCELRQRVFFVALALLGGTLLGYALHDGIVQTLLVPLGDEKLVYLTPGGGFDFIFKASFYFGAILTIPIATYQLYRYLAPAMVRATRRFAVFVIGVSALLAAVGVVFGYMVALPAALRFLTGFAGEYVEANLTASSYLNFVVMYSLGLAALFQLPLILLFINKINGPLSPSKLLKTEPYVLLGVFILAAVITPTPDIFNQLVVAGPVLVAYQLGVVMVLVQNRRRARTRPALAQRQPVTLKEPAKGTGATPQPPRPILAVPQPARNNQPVMTDIVATRQSVVRPIPKAPPRPAHPRVRRTSIDGFAFRPNKAVDSLGNNA